jgi:predicted phosphodiesterase
MKVLIAGDTHGSKHALADIYTTAAASGCEAIIQLGDFGYGWSLGESGRDGFSEFASKLYRKIGIPLFFIDGNHENFDRLFARPISKRDGLRHILPGVIHLPRGSNLVLEGVTFRAFGGAYSVDKGHRSEGTSWWPQETITDEDVAASIAAGPADIFLSHDFPFGMPENAGTKRKLVEWGPSHAYESIKNASRVRDALVASGARYAFHGHLHHQHESWMDADGDHVVLVRGMSCDGMYGNTYVLDLDDIKNELG